MRFTVSPEQQKFFNLQHYLELEDLLSVEESKALFGAINNLRTKSPGYPDENLFRSIPLIASLAKKKGWGQVVADLLHKKPVRLASDTFSSSPPDLIKPLDDDSCGLIIELKSRRGLFFKRILPTQHLYNRPESCYLFLILTTNYLPEHIHPIIIK